MLGEECEGALGFFRLFAAKKLKEGEREKLLDQILTNEHIGWVIVELSAEFISQEMLRVQPVSLNRISYDAVIKALKTINDIEPNPPLIGDIYIDTVGDPEFYKSTLTSALGKDFGNFVIEKKADANYKVVSAASIIAKVTRDHMLMNWKWHESSVTLDKNFGSGYPSDERCIQWLEQAQHPVFGYPNLIRFSWSTARDLLCHRDKGIGIVNNIMV